MRRRRTGLAAPAQRRPAFRRGRGLPVAQRPAAAWTRPYYKRQILGSHERTLRIRTMLCGKGHPPPSGCTFIVRYGNERQGSICNPPGCLCNPNSCGGGIQLDFLDVKALGSGCPSLALQPVTETVTLDSGCMKVPDPITGSFTLDSKGKVPPDASDTYRLCFPKSKVDIGLMLAAGECTQTATQKVFVGGMLADTRMITFRVTFRGDLSEPDFLSCPASVTRK